MQFDKWSLDDADGKRVTITGPVPEIGSYVSFEGRRLLVVNHVHRASREFKGAKVGSTDNIFVETTEDAHV